jgi:hypothetical protein
MVTNEICEVCGAILDNSEACIFNVPKEQAPSLADYEAMARGEMNHVEHQVLVGRWGLHNTESLSPQAVLKMREFAVSAWGKKVKLFAL